MLPPPLKKYIDKEERFPIFYETVYTVCTVCPEILFWRLLIDATTVLLFFIATKTNEIYKSNAKIKRIGNKIKHTMIIIYGF